MRVILTLIYDILFQVQCYARYIDYNLFQAIRTALIQRFSHKAPSFSFSSPKALTTHTRLFSRLTHSFILSNRHKRFFFFLSFPFLFVPLLTQSEQLEAQVALTVHITIFHCYYSLSFYGGLKNLICSSFFFSSFFFVFSCLVKTSCYFYCHVSSRPISAAAVSFFVFFPFLQYLSNNISLTI